MTSLGAKVSCDVGVIPCGALWPLTSDERKVIGKGQPGRLGQKSIQYGNFKRTGPARKTELSLDT